MKKLIEKFKNFGSVIQILLFVADALKAVVECWEKHFPQKEEIKQKIEGKEA